MVSATDKSISTVLLSEKNILPWLISSNGTREWVNMFLKREKDREGVNDTIRIKNKQK